MKRFLTATLGAFCVLACPALADGKRAFIVGVGEYEELTDLEKTLGDAENYARVFEEDLGFEVTKVADPTRRDFLMALDGFLSSIEAGDEVVFIFSGHGWSDRTENYLVLSDAPLAASETLMKSETVAITSTVLNEIKARNPKVTIAIIDACRNYPFESFTRNAFGRGLARTTVEEGMLVMYAAGAGQEALDRLSDDDPEPTSVFTRVLLPKLTQTERPLPDIAREVKTRVRDLAAGINHKQNPAYVDELLSTLCFSGTCSTGGSDTDPEQTAWLAASSATGDDACRLMTAYLEDYPGGRFSGQATLLVGALDCPEAENKLAIQDDPNVFTAPDFSVLKTFGTAREDEFRAVAPLEDGGAWLFGSTLNSPNGSRSYYAVRVNDRGRMVATQTWETEVNAWGNAAAPARDGGVWVTGGIDVPDAPTNMTERGYVAKLDGQGEVVFSRIIDGGGWTRMNGAAPAEDGGVWLAGYAHVEGDWQRMAAYVVKLDADGNTVFERAYEGATMEQAFAITAKPGGGAFLAGQTKFEQSERSADASMMELDDTGEIVWDVRTGFPGFDLALGINARADGGFYLAGFTEEEDDSELGSKRNAMIVSINPDRSLGWSRTFGDNGTGVRAIVSWPDGGAWAAGYTTWDLEGNSNDDVDAYNNNGYLLRIDETGEILAQHVYGGEDGDDFIDIAQGADGAVWIAGSSEREGTGQDAIAAVIRKD